MRRRKKINKVLDSIVTKGLILGFYTPLAVYIYACVLTDGVKQYYKQTRK